MRQMTLPGEGLERRAAGSEPFPSAKNIVGSFRRASGPPEIELRRLQHGRSYQIPKSGLLVKYFRSVSELSGLSFFQEDFERGARAAWPQQLLLRNAFPLYDCHLAIYARNIDSLHSAVRPLNFQLIDVVSRA